MSGEHKITVNVNWNSIDGWDVLVRGDAPGAPVGRGKSRNLERAVSKAVKRAGLEANLKTREQLHREQDYSRRQTEMDSLRRRVTNLEGRLSEVDSANETREMLGEEPLDAAAVVEETADGAIHIDLPGGSLHIPGDLAPVGRDARAQYVKEMVTSMLGAPPTTLNNVFATQAGMQGEDLEARLDALDVDIAYLGERLNHLAQNVLPDLETEHDMNYGHLKDRIDNLVELVNIFGKRLEAAGLQ